MRVLPFGVATTVAIAVGVAGAGGLEAQTQAVVGCTDRLPGAAVTLGDLLQGKLAGVTVLQSDGGPSGGAKRIRIRGVNSVRGSEPIIVVDNVRVTPLSEAGLRGAYSIPLLEFVDPATIQRVEILRGPTATIQYADASGGVIRISTRRGSGEARDVGSDSPPCNRKIKKPS